MCRSPRMSARETRRGSRPSRAARISSSPSANFGRDEGQAEARVDLVFGGGGREEVDVSLARETLRDVLTCSTRSGEHEAASTPASGRTRKSNAELHAIEQQVQAALALRWSTRPTSGRRDEILDDARRDRREAATISRSPTESWPRLQRSGAASPTRCRETRGAASRIGIDDADRASERNAGNRSCEASAARRRRRPLSLRRGRESSESPARATAAPSSAALVAPRCW